MVGNETRAALERALSGSAAIIGIGNSLRNDDGAGPYVADRLLPGRSAIHVLNAHDRPENFIKHILNLRVTKALLIDAADFGGEAGEIRIIPKSLIPDTAVSTHAIPLSLIAGLLEAGNIEVVFAGIQKADTGFGETLSLPVLAAANELVDFINKLIA